MNENIVVLYILFINDIHTIKAKQETKKREKHLMTMMMMSKVTVFYKCMNISICMQKYLYFTYKHTHDPLYSFSLFQRTNCVCNLSVCDCFLLKEMHWNASWWWWCWWWYSNKKNILNKKNCILKNPRVTFFLLLL